MTGTHNILWDGKDGNGVAFPAGNYRYCIVGRNGEVHFPMADVEDINERPTLTKLRQLRRRLAEHGLLRRPRLPRVERLSRRQPERSSLRHRQPGHRCGHHRQRDHPAEPERGTVGGRLGGRQFQRQRPLLPRVDRLYGQQQRLQQRRHRILRHCQDPRPVGAGTLAAVRAGNRHRLPTSNVDVGTAVNAPPVLPSDTVYGSFNFTTQAALRRPGSAMACHQHAGSCPASALVNVPNPPAIGYSYNASTCVLSLTGMPTTLNAGASSPASAIRSAQPRPVPVDHHPRRQRDLRRRGLSPNSPRRTVVRSRSSVESPRHRRPAAGRRRRHDHLHADGRHNAPLTSALVLTDVLGAGLDFGAIAGNPGSHFTSMPVLRRPSSSACRPAGHRHLFSHRHRHRTPAVERCQQRHRQRWRRRRSADLHELQPRASVIARRTRSARPAAIRRR